tara:strand:- start:31 stop:414 length:384 start_codon:yes stop_codon:yes gene_type:complete
MSEGYLLDAESIQLLRQDHEFLASIVQSQAGRRHINHAGGGGGGSAMGRLTSAITPADDSLTGTTFTFRKFIVDDGTTKPKTLKEDTDDTDGVNRSTLLTANVDGFVIVSKIHGEWIPVYCEDICPA